MLNGTEPIASIRTVKSETLKLLDSHFFEDQQNLKRLEVNLKKIGKKSYETLQYAVKALI